MRKVISCLAITTVIALSGCSDAGQVSGVYTQKQGNSLLFIQIVKTEDGKVTGRGEAINVMPDGSLKDQSFPLEGSADGAQISLKSNVFLGFGQSFSGTVSGNTLTIVTDTGQATLKRSSLDVFTRQKNDLAVVAKAALDSNERAKNAADQQAYLTALAVEGKEFAENLPKAYPALDQKVDAILANLQNRHDVIVGKIKKLKARWLITPSDDKGSVEGDIQSQQSDFQALASDYDARVSEVRSIYDQLESGLNEFKAKCDKAVSLAYSPIPAQCANAQTYITQYQDSRAATKAKFDAASAAMFPKE